MIKRYEGLGGAANKFDNRGDCVPRFPVNNKNSKRVTIIFNFLDHEEFVSVLG